MSALAKRNADQGGNHGSHGHVHGDDDEMANYIKGISVASFCRPKADQRYISLAHFLSLQPRECMKVRDEYYPDMIIDRLDKIFPGRSTLRSLARSAGKTALYLWLPTPPKKSVDQVKYSRECRKRMLEVLAPGSTNPGASQFDEIWLDVRGNIGGVLSTVLDAIYPMLAKHLNGVYLYGVDDRGEHITTFAFETDRHAGVRSMDRTQSRLSHIIRPGGQSIIADILPVEPALADIFDGKPINILCNRYTMSTGEITCIVVRKLGGKVYGEKTRGLTNGMEIVSSAGTKSALVPYYSIADGDTIYRDGVEPDYSF